MRILFINLLLTFALSLSAQQTTLYFEDFNSYSDGVQTGTGTPAYWTTPGGSAPEWEVRSNEFRGYDDCANSQWITKDIDVAGYSNIFFSMDVSDANLDITEDNYFRIYYRIDGGSWIEIFKQRNELNINTFDYQLPVNGNSTVTIKIRVDIDWSSGGKYFFDNVKVEDCQGINAGTVSLDEDTVINNTPVELTLSGQDASTTLQWQISEDGGNSYTSLNNATVSPYTTFGLLGEKWYYFRAKVDNGSCFTYSTLDSVFVGGGYCSTNYDILIYDTINSNVTYDDMGVVYQVHPVSQINGNVTVEGLIDGFNNFGEINGNLTYDGNDGYFCNEGTIVVDNLTDNSNGDPFSNYGFITINNNFTIDNNGGSWHSWCDFNVGGDLIVDGNSEPHFTGTMHINGDLKIQNNGSFYLEDSSIIVVDGDIIIDCTAGNYFDLGVNSFVSCNNLIFSSNSNIRGTGTNSNEYAQIIINGTSTSNGHDYEGYLDVCGFSSGDNPDLGPNVTECVNMVIPAPTTSYCTGSYVRPLTAYITDFNNDTCNAACRGNATVTPYGGYLPITYLWDNGNTDSTATALCAGVHSVTVTDDVDSVVVVNVTISEPSPISVSFNTTDANCFGSNDGVAIAIPTGGNGATWTYHWDANAGGGTADSSNVLAYGTTYTVSVYDNLFCKQTAIVTIGQPSEVAIGGIIDVQPSCHDSINGQLSVDNPHGGTPSYTYLWSDGQTTQIATDLADGTYSVTVEDSHHCQHIETNIILNEPDVLANTNTIVNAKCYGGSTGEINTSVTGGTANYSYEWSTGSTSTNLTGVIAADYDLTITDNHGCKLKQNNISIGQAPEIIISIDSNNDASCGHEDGNATVSAIGGTGSIDFKWNVNPIQTGATISNVYSGTYTVIAEDTEGCIDSLHVTIDDASAPTISVTNQTNINCHGNNTGSISVSGSGGTGTLSYSWTGITPNPGNVTSVSNLEDGTYNVTVTDGNSCSASTSIAITEPDTLSVTIGSLIEPQCNAGTDGSATATGHGGPVATGYDYTWSAGTNINSATNTGLSASTIYTVTVEDDNHCTATDIVTLTEPDAVSIDATTFTEPDCFGENNATATVTTVTGGTSGTGTYSYAWNTSPAQSGQTATGLSATSYKVTVTDDYGCTDTISINITQPTLLQVNISSIVQPTCNGGNNGSVTAIGIDGTVAYSYLWGANTGSQTTATVTGLSANTYYVVTVTDANECTVKDSISISEPSAVNIVSTSFTEPLCNGDTTGTATVTSVTGGTVVGAYTYLWAVNAGSQTAATATGLSANINYDVTVFDDSLCFDVATVTLTQPTQLHANISTSTISHCYAGSDGNATAIGSGGTEAGLYDFQWGVNTGNQVTATATGLSANTYYVVTVTDDNSCTAVDSVSISEPTPINIQTDSITNVLCNGDNTGAVAFTVIGGTPNPNPNNYEYSFNDISYINDSSYTGMTAGNYWIYVKDANACKDSLNFDITEPLNPISLTPSSSNSTCSASNGSATVTAIDGTPGYTYSWADDITDTTNTLSNISAGGYVVSVTDTHGCIESITVNVSDFGAGTLTFLNDTHNVCYGDTIGTVEVNILGGTAPYNYTWDNGQTDSIATNLGAGTYTVEVEDDNNCIVTSSFTILDSTEINITLTQYNLNCFNDNSGIITADVTGGSPTNTTDYNYSWNNGLAGINLDSISGLSATEYILSVTDQYNCLITDTIILTQPDSLVLDSIIITNLRCYNDFSGAAEINTISGGTTPYSYAWSNSESTTIINNLNIGTYIVTVIDQNLCAISDSIDIEQPDSIIVTSVIQPTFCNRNLGHINLDVTGGTTDYSFNWASGLIDSNFVDTLYAGTYNLTITDAHGCQYSNNYQIQNIPAGIIAVVDSSNLNCYNDNSGKIITQIIGGTPIYNFKWEIENSVIQSNNLTENIDSIFNISAGTYTLTVKDSNNCITTKEILISQPDSLQVSFTHSNITCNGDDDAYIYTNVQGGTESYNYNWSNGATNDTLNNLNGGTYQLELTDHNGCQLTDSISIIEPSILVLKNSKKDVSCNDGSNGEIHLSFYGGTAQYSLNWDNIEINTIDSIHMVAGTYHIIITDSLGCKKRNTIEITQPEAYELNYTKNNATCFGFNDGSIELNITGETKPYTYLWSTNETTNSIDSLNLGLYTIQILDSNLCEYNDTIEITQPTAIEVDTLISYQNGLGQITLDVQGGTPTYNYNWSNGATDYNNPDLQGGAYSVTITDVNACEYKISFIIQDENPLVIPNLISPNGDELNDTWNIKYISRYKQIDIEIYNRWGNIIYTFNGSGEEYSDKTRQFNGTYKGQDLPIGGYVYILNLHDDKEVKKGVLSIIRTRQK